ncbi:MAG: M48 family metallopeptidase [Candidatus Competibacteraceae bacterium]|nr:M48 family metallopeptidase [Candidatus Competibacteraceae bacterium]
MSQPTPLQSLVRISGSKGSLEYGNESIRFEIVFTRRKTLQVSVHADERVAIRAPLGTSTDKIAEWLRKQAAWIIKHRHNFRRQPKVPQLRYLSGELHLYLGRHYRLRVRQGARDRVTLNDQELLVECVATATSARTRQLLEVWYQQQALVQFAESLERCFSPFRRLGLARPSLRIQRMKTRWGSMSVKNRMSLNLDLIHTPLECLDYVVTHELCHLLHRNHGPGFYRLLAQLMPDWRMRKHTLKNIQISPDSHN